MNCRCSTALKLSTSALVGLDALRFGREIFGGGERKSSKSPLLVRFFSLILSHLSASIDTKRDRSVRRTGIGVLGGELKKY